MIIEIHDRGDAEDAALQAALQRIALHQHLERVDVFIEPRKKDGWLEYGIKFQYAPAGQLFVGMIQREPGANFEFHS